MKLADQLGIALAERGAVDVVGQAEHAERVAFAGRKTVDPAPRPAGAIARANRIERVGEIAPRWRGVGTGHAERAGCARPARIGTLRLGDLFRAHAVKVIVGGVVL